MSTDKSRLTEQTYASVETIEAITLGGDGEVAARFEVIPDRPKALSTVRFDGSASWCSEGDSIVEYRWDFGDETVTVSREKIVEHNFPVAGRYTVRLLVRTRQGMEAEITKSVRVGFRLDIDHQPRFPLTSKTVTFTARAFVNLHAEDKITTYAWDLTGSGVFDKLTNDAELSCEYPKPGVYAVKVRAVSVNGIQEETSHAVEIHSLTKRINDHR